MARSFLLTGSAEAPRPWWDITPDWPQVPQPTGPEYCKICGKEYHTNINDLNNCLRSLKENGQ